MFEISRFIETKLLLSWKIPIEGRACENDDFEF